MMFKSEKQFDIKRVESDCFDISFSASLDPKKKIHVGLIEISKSSIKQQFKVFGNKVWGEWHWVFNEDGMVLFVSTFDLKYDHEDIEEMLSDALDDLFSEYEKKVSND